MCSVKFTPLTPPKKKQISDGFRTPMVNFSLSKMYSCPLKCRPPQTWSWQNPTSVLEQKIPNGVLQFCLSSDTWRILRAWKVWLNFIFKQSPWEVFFWAHFLAHVETEVSQSPTCKQSHMRRMAKTCHANATQGIGRCATPKPIEIGKVSGRRSTKAPAWLWEFWNSKYHTINPREFQSRSQKALFWHWKPFYSNCNSTNTVIET